VIAERSAERAREDLSPERAPRAAADHHDFVDRGARGRQRVLTIDEGESDALEPFDLLSGRCRG
jgi:hypothetical protein